MSRRRGLRSRRARPRSRSFGLATYKAYASTDPNQVAEISAAIENEYNAAKRSLDNVLTYIPRAVEDVDRILLKLDFAHVIVRDLKRALAAGDRAAAQQILDIRFDAARDDVTGQMTRLINILGGEARQVEAEAVERSAWIFNVTIAALAIGTLAALVVAFGFAHLSIARPLRRMAKAMTRMAAGDLNVAVEGTNRVDEIGGMAQAVEVFRGNAVALREAEYVRGIEREQSEAEKRGALEDVAVSFEAGILKIAAAVEQSATELESCSRSMALVTDESQRHAEVAKSNAHETTAGAAGVAAAIEELSASIAEISAQVVNASGIMAEATRCADSTASNTTALVATVKDIDQVADRNHRHRQPDQPSGAQRHHRGRACRRGRPWLRGGGSGGQGARGADHQRRLPTSRTRPPR